MISAALSEVGRLVALYQIPLLELLFGAILALHAEAFNSLRISFWMMEACAMVSGIVGAFLREQRVLLSALFAIKQFALWSVVAVSWR